MNGWSPGDMARCVANGRWVDSDTLEAVPGPARGSDHRVRGTMTDPQFGLMLFLDGFPGNDPENAYPARLFRKLPELPTATDAAERMAFSLPCPGRKPEPVA